MKKSFYSFVLLVLANTASAEPFTVENKVFTVTNRVPVTKIKTVVKMTMSTRAPVGQHTHTCMNPNCPILKQFGRRNTWDHPANASHICQFCKTEQRVQDTYRLPVTVFRGVEVAVDAPAPTVAQAQRPAQASPVFVLPQSAAGCVSGQCAVPQRRLR